MTERQNELSNTDKVNWESVCCCASCLGELSIEWWEIQKGGIAQLMRQGVCAACGEKSNFVEEPCE